MKVYLKGLLGDSIIYGFGSFIVSSAQVFIIPIIFIYLNKEEFGRLDYFLSIKNLLVIVYGFGILTSIFKFSNSQNKKDTSPFNGILVVLFISLFFVILQLVLQYFFIDLKDSSQNLYYIQAISIFGALLTIPLGVLRQKRKPGIYIIINLINTILFLTVAYLLIKFTNLNYRAILIGQITANLFSFIVGFILVKKYIVFKYSREQFRQMLNFGFSILITSLSFVFILTSTRLFLEAKTSFEDVGLIGMAQKFSLFVGALLISPFSLAWLPYVKMNFENPNFTITVNKVFSIYSIVSLFFCFTLQLVLVDFFLYFNQTEYINAINYILPFSLSYLFQGLYYIFSSGIFLSNSSRGYKIIGVAGPLFNLLLYFLFINYISLGAVSLITLSSFIFVTSLAYLFGNKIMKVNVFSRKNLILYAMYSLLFIGLYILPMPNSFSTSIFLIKISFIIILFFVHIYNGKNYLLANHK